MLAYNLCRTLAREADYMHWKRIRIFTSYLLVAAACCYVLSVHSSQEEDESCQIFVRAGESLQAAIDGAPVGAILSIEEGTWEESIVISKSITLRGRAREKTTIRGTEAGYPVIWVKELSSDEKTEVALEGIHVTEAQGRACAELSLYEDHEVCPYGILADGSVHVIISDCDVSQNRSGIVGVGSPTLVVKRSNVRLNEWEGIYVADAAVASVYDCQVMQNGFVGIGAADDALISIVGSTIEENHGDGIGVADYGVAFVSDNTIAHNGWSGVKLIFAATASFDSNRIIANKGFGIAPFSGQCYEGEQAFVGLVEGSGNWIPGPGDENGNLGGAICPQYPGQPWPQGFLTESEPQD